jgi:hypothetical protein
MHGPRGHVWSAGVGFVRQTDGRALPPAGHLHCTTPGMAGARGCRQKRDSTAILLSCALAAFCAHQRVSAFELAGSSRASVRAAAARDGLAGPQDEATRALKQLAKHHRPSRHVSGVGDRVVSQMGAAAGRATSTLGTFAPAAESNRAVAMPAPQPTDTDTDARALARTAAARAIGAASPRPSRVLTTAILIGCCLAAAVIALPRRLDAR